MKWFVMVAAILVLSVAVQAAGDGLVLPSEGFAPGWAREGQSKVYEGEALYDHIDGGGEAFLEMGFEACTVQSYKRGPESIVLEIYRMRDAAGALGIYLASCGHETPDKDLAERHTVGRNQILLVKGRYYIVATSPEASPGMTKVLTAAGRAVAGKIPASDPPPCLAFLPKEGLEPRSVRIVRGPIGLQAIVTLGEGDVLLLERLATAVSGDYKGSGGEVRTVIVAEYPSGQAAQEALKHLIQRLDPTLSLVSAGDRGLVFKDGKGRFGKAEVEGSRLMVRFGLTQKPD
jgi:hypothetical protein